MNNNKVQAIVEKVKELVQRGNVSRIVVRKGERVLLNIPVNVGIVGGVVAVASAKWPCIVKRASIRRPRRPGPFPKRKRPRSRKRTPKFIPKSTTKNNFRIQTKREKSRGSSLFFAFLSIGAVVTAWSRRTSLSRRR